MTSTGNPRKEIHNGTSIVPPTRGEVEYTSRRHVERAYLWTLRAELILDAQWEDDDEATLTQNASVRNYIALAQLHMRLADYQSGGISADLQEIRDGLLGIENMIRGPRDGR